MFYKDKTEGNAMVYPHTQDHLGGLTKIEHFALLATDDFDEMSYPIQCNIVGRNPPENKLPEGHYFGAKISPFNESDPEFITWLLEGRAKWKLMQAKALIEELNREEQL